MTNLGKSCGVLLIVLVIVNCRVVQEAKNIDFGKNESLVKSTPLSAQQESKQIFLGASGKETNTPNFVRLVVMRLIYGLASTMGVEERLESALNGVFVPPNADGGFFNFGGGGDADGDEDLLGGLGDVFDY